MTLGPRKVKVRVQEVDSFEPLDNIKILYCIKSSLSCLHFFRTIPVHQRQLTLNIAGIVYGYGMYLILHASIVEARILVLLCSTVRVHNILEYRTCNATMRRRSVQCLVPGLNA